jgi:hypothetical protein
MPIPAKQFHPNLSLSLGFTIKIAAMNLIAESEHAHSHHHGTGIRWVDMTVAISAIFISVVSLVISIEHGRTMEQMVKENEKMVAASTIPFLTWSGSQFDPVTNQPRLRLILKNGGIGPARIAWFQLRYRDVPYSSENALLRACCSTAVGKDADGIPGAFYSNVSGTILPQRDSLDVIDLQHEVSLDLRNALDAARNDIRIKTCYCSVLDECWQADLSEGLPSRPVRVDACEIPAASTLW